MRKNKPNFGELAGAWNPHYSTIPSFHHSNPISVVRNEAKLGWTGGYGKRRLSRAAWLGRGVKRAKRTQSWEESHVGSVKGHTRN
jgi:hypothetical protein